MKTATRRQQRLFEKVCERILAGEGAGHDELYRPWLALNRKNSSKVSNQLQIWMPPLRRTASYFSRGEYRVAMLLLWLGVSDLREQYPIWPTRHPHPLDSARYAPADLRWSRGLLKIAADAGIDHGWEIGTKVPYIATIDLAATVLINGVAHLFLYSLKPIGSDQDSIGWRTAERLELERRYAHEISTEYQLIYSGIVNHTIAANLEQWMVFSDLTAYAHLAACVQPFAQTINSSRYLPIRDAISLAARECAIDEDGAWVLLRHCAWHQYIDVDPRIVLLHSYPLPAGGHAFRKALQEQFFGQS